MITIVTSSLRDQIADVVLDRILSGQYRPGERLSPETLRAEFGVSITPIREALQRLASSGFVDVRAREGAYVSKLDARRASEIYDVRSALEVQAARLSTPLIPQSALEALGERFREADAALAAGHGDDVLEPLEPEIHDLMLRYSDNAVLQDMLATLHQQGAWARAIAGKGAHYLRSAFEEHKLILQALINRDAEAAAEATRRHLEATRDTVVQFLARTETTEGARAG